jgi:hypothetical protein
MIQIGRVYVRGVIATKRLLNSYQILYVAIIIILSASTLRKYKNLKQTRGYG